MAKFRIEQVEENDGCLDNVAKLVGYIVLLVVVLALCKAAAG